MSPVIFHAGAMSRFTSAVRATWVRCGRAFVLVSVIFAMVAFACGAGAQEAMLGGSGAIDAGGATQAFREANSLYSQERFEDAAAVYEAILQGGFENADVQYNLGNAYYKAGRLGSSVLAYERALKLDPSHEDAARNITFLGELLADRRAPVGGAMSAFLAGLSARFTVERLSVLTSVLYFILFAALVVVTLRGPFATWARRLAIVMVVHLAVFGGLLAFRVAQARANVEAVVMAHEVGVRTGPGEDFMLEFRLHEGTKVRLGETRVDDGSGAWARVSVAGTDLEGWLPSESVEKI
jgi:hypothetical protein